MAVVSITYSDALDARIKDPVDGWGGIQEWKDWVKTETRRQLLDRRSRRIWAEQEAATRSMLEAAANDGSLL